ncbi:uncharacterized protein LOC124401771 isoform X2 [Silurus meridionalis]|uniref:uncharacterized protein LOC124401771 isoform X2 n=1 Tax=Silurus meridionalis TaxID=175797 RepID=UPI001EEC7CC4|nr:uncharacterized protein LOC124401771 isoform X2 [Silurus meridionalis]
MSPNEAAVMMKCLYLLSVVFHVAAGCDLSGDDNWLEITQLKGGSVLLPCSCSDLLSKPQTFTWMIFRTGRLTEMLNDEHYRGRLELFNNTSPANLSLLISDLREEDEGNYRCSTEKEHRYITLYVKGCELVNKKEVVVVTGFTGESVVLPCFCTDLQDDPKTIKWELHFQEIYPEQTEQHKNRVKQVNKNPPGNLSLLISNLTKEDEGFYTCFVQRDWTYVTLYVNVKTESSTPSRKNDTTPVLDQLTSKTTFSPPASSSTTQVGKTETSTSLRKNDTTPVLDQPTSKTTISPPASSSTTQVLGSLVALLPGIVVFLWWSCKGRRSGEYVMTKEHLECMGKQKDQRGSSTGSDDH